MLSNKDDDLSQVSNICRPIKNNGKKTHTRYCQYTPTWFKSGQESTIGCSRRNVCKPRTEILDLNSKEILDLEKIEACANMNKTARKEIDSLKRKLKEYSTDCEELRSGEADTINLCLKSNDSPIDVSEKDDECSSKVTHLNCDTCQTLREFLNSKKYRLRYGIPIPYLKLTVSMKNCLKDDVQLDKTMKYSHLIIFHIYRIQLSKIKSVKLQTQKLKLRGGGSKKQNEPKKIISSSEEINNALNCLRYIKAFQTKNCHPKCVVSKNCSMCLFRSCLSKINTL